jgi:hypothetical protein
MRRSRPNRRLFMFHVSTLSRVTRTALLLTVCLLVCGCGKNKVTKANFDKLKEGMTLAEVEAILGPGEKQTGDAANVAGQFGVALPSNEGAKGVDTYVWEKGNKKIQLCLVNGKVAGQILQSGL